MFDYKEAQKKVMENLDIFNINGKNQVRQILEYLEICPFFETVADHMSIEVKTIYDKLSYYLDADDWKSLREDVKERGNRSIRNYKRSRRAELFALDDEKECMENQE